MEIPRHAEVFAALGALDYSGESFPKLRLAAEVLDAVEEVDGIEPWQREAIESRLRAVAGGLTGSSEASLFSGYVNPRSASTGDLDATAGRLLRSFRDRDLETMVQAANANVRVFSSYPAVGVLTLGTLLLYELVRPLSEPPLGGHVVEFLSASLVPVCGAEVILELIFGGLVLAGKAGWEEAVAKEMSAPLVVLMETIIERIPERRTVIADYVKWSLGIEAAMNARTSSRTLPQCGAEFHSTFATKASIVALMVSERSEMVEFRTFDAPSETVYGTWQRALTGTSPKGDSYGSMELFSPDDLHQAALNGSNGIFGVFSRLAKLIDSQPDLTRDWYWEGLGVSAGGEFLRRTVWLGALGQLLAGKASVSGLLEVFSFDQWQTTGPTGPVTLMQWMFLSTLVETGFRFVEDEDEDEDEDSQIAKEDFKRAMESIGIMSPVATQEIGAGLVHRNIPPDEARALSAWADLIAEIRGVAPQEPPAGYEVTDSKEDFDIWLSQLCWWLKNRGWRPKKERPIAEDLGPDPAVVVKQSDPLEELAGSLPEYEVLEPNSPIEVVFVGGDQGQAKKDQEINIELSQRHGGLVTITWVHINWSSNWGKEMTQISGNLKRGADALVLMPLVRTTMGAHVRREAGRLGIPWISCTGQGRGTIVRALEEAVQVVCRQRLS